MVCRMRFLCFVGFVSLAQTLCSIPAAGQSPLDQQLQAQYPPGAVLELRQKGVSGVNPECAALLVSTYKQDGQLHAASVLQKTAAAGFGCLFRAFPPGWKVNSQLVAALPRQGKVVFIVQECDACNGGGSVSYRARVEFQFQKGSLDATAVMNAVAQVFTVANPPASPPPPVSVPALGSVYVSSANSADRLQLSADHTFSLAEGGQAFSGTYTADGNKLTLHIVELQKDVDIVIDGATLLVNGEEVWVQPTS